MHAYLAWLAAPSRLTKAGTSQKLLQSPKACPKNFTGSYARNPFPSGGGCGEGRDQDSRLDPVLPGELRAGSWEISLFSSLC